MEKFYVTTPIYYVNARPHIGSAYTTIAADVLARYWRGKLGDDQVFFLTGTDEHGAKVAESAVKEGKTPEQFTDEVSAQFRAAWQKLNISHNDFLRTTEERHKIGAQKFLSLLHEKGALYEDQYEGLYCIGCERFLTEKELVDGKCPLHNTVPEKIQEKNYFFKLKEWLPKVKEAIEQDKIKIQPEWAKKEVLGLFKQDLADFSVSREKVQWGIPLPWDESQRIYVWVEALTNYLTAIGYGSDEEKVKQWWPAQYHLMAKDILKFHAVYWPAMLLAADLPLPEAEFIHGFFTVNGQKMSKSLGNAIDPNALVDQYGADATRYLLLAQFPFGQDGDIKEEAFAEQYQAALANGLGNVVARVTKMVEQYLDGEIDASVAIDDFTHFPTEIGQAIEQLDFFTALQKLQQAISLIDEEIEKVKPWQLAKEEKSEELRSALSRYILCLRTLHPLVSPFMPEAGEKMRQQLEAEKIVKGEGLFPRIVA
ncbi:MAG: methionine--tRNA ligase [Candidatus Nomurabacteria bacterium]|nr:MAG: methionine--tRNA ligase [Candidatus Nomurabacteria bacterium]